YGLGQATLMPIAAELSDSVAVGSVHEVVSVPDRVTPVVLTPSLEAPERKDVIMTVGAVDHVSALRGWPGRVVVKLQSSMRRYGTDPDSVEELLASVAAAGIRTVGYSLHGATVGTDEERLGEAITWAELLGAPRSISVSHLAPTSYRRLIDARPDVEWRLRAGTALWHGDKSALRLEADVVDRHAVSAGDRAGYHMVDVPGDGTVAMVGAGAAHAIAPVAAPGGHWQSPFHFAGRRLALIEPPHMHTSMVFIPAGSPTPTTGEWVDVQRPLIGTAIDRLVWR
ncbi:MAG: alanine racemase, partial [Actinomycetota bacterium]|nr:alanine racemase [Actinomycetota bacterium]